MNNQATITKNYTDNDASLFVSMLTYSISKIMELWSVFLTQIGSLMQRFKSKAKRISWTPNDFDRSDDAPEETGFYNLFHDKDLFQKTYGHSDNPLLK